MAKRAPRAAAVPTPAAIEPDEAQPFPGAIDDDGDDDIDLSDGEEESWAADDAELGEEDAEDEQGGDLADGDDEPNDAPDVEPAPASAVRDSLSARALRTLSVKMRGRPLADQSNQWVLSTMGRLYDEFVDGVADGEPIAQDLAILFDAARVRDVIGQLSDAVREGIRHMIADYGIIAVQTGDASATMMQAPAGASTGLVPVSVVDERVIELPIGDVAPDRDQPRDEGADAEIADEMYPDTVLPPIELRAHPKAGESTWPENPNVRGHPSHTHPPYMIVDGERRWRASIKAGRTTIRAIVNTRPMDTGDLLLRQAALNQGKRLKPLEEARAWKRIIDAKQWSVQQLADYLKKPRSTVADRVAMLEAPKPFLRLFEQGILTPAAAPLVRPLSDLDEETALEILDACSDVQEWDDAMLDGRVVALDDVERALVRACEVVLIPLGQYPSLKKRYKGKRVVIKKHEFAVDMDEVDALNAEVKREQAEQSKGDRATAPTPAKSDPALDRYKAARSKEEKQRKAKAALRLAQFRAVSAKLPKTLTRDWALMLARGLVGEMTQDTSRLAVRALALRESKSASGGLNFDRDLIKHAESLTSPVELLQFMTHCLMAHDLYVNPNYDGGTKRLSEAAKLAGVNLAKVKVADPAKPDAAAKPAAATASGQKKVKKSEKTGGGAPAKRASSRSTMRSPNMAFITPLTPSSALAVIVGAKAIPRTEIAKKLWAYIKKHGLQDTKERRMINADDKLRAVFKGKQRVSMFDMTKLINQHLTPTVK